MGQKVNPHGLRVGIIKDWDTKWYAEKDFADYLVEDVKIRKFIKKKLYVAGVSKIAIERTAGRVKISVYTAKPGIVIGKNGQAIEELKAEIQKMTSQKVAVNIEEIKRPETDAQLVAERFALDLENRVTFRRAMKQAMGRTMKFGAKGIKTAVSGRLGGADIARTESYHDGTIPLQTLRADIDYGFAEAATTFGRIGVKVWIYKGEILSQALRTTPRTLDTSKPYQERRERRGRRDGDRRGGFRRDGQGFNRDRQNGGYNRGPRPEGGFRKPAEKKEGGAQ